MAGLVIIAGMVLAQKIEDKRREKRIRKMRDSDRYQELQLETRERMSHYDGRADFSALIEDDDEDDYWVDSEEVRQVERRMSAVAESTRENKRRSFISRPLSWWHNEDTNDHQFNSEKVRRADRRKSTTTATPNDLKRKSFFSRRITFPLKEEHEDEDIVDAYGAEADRAHVEQQRQRAAAALEGGPEPKRKSSFIPRRFNLRRFRGEGEKYNEYNADAEKFDIGRAERRKSMAATTSKENKRRTFITRPLSMWLDK